MLLQNLMNNSHKDQGMRYSKMLDGATPIFSQFGQNIYTSDIVQMCIDTIAQEMSKLQPKHIYTGPSGVQQVPNSSINALFKFSPNPLMTTSEFIEKITWLFMLTNSYKKVLILSCAALLLVQCARVTLVQQADLYQNEEEYIEPDLTTTSDHGFKSAVARPGWELIWADEFDQAEIDSEW